MKILRRLRPPRKILNDFYVLDTETGRYNKSKTKFKYDLIGRPENFIFGCIYGKNYTKIFHTIEEMKEELLTHRFKDRYVFGHNMEYDLNVLYDNIYQFDNEAIFNGRFITAKNGNCKFADSFNIYQHSAEKIGDFLGKPKLDLRLDKWRTKVTTQDINYCIRDCEIIYDALFEIFNEVGDIKITQASLSMTYYRRYYQPYDICHNEHTRNFWPSYYGGRTEVFFQGKTNAVVYDIKSSYPNAMVNAKFPNTKHLRKLLNVTPQTAINYIQSYEGCAQVTVKHKHTYFGYLPYRQEGKLLFPVGTFKGCWNFNELRYALDQNVIEITQVDFVVFSRGIDSPFIDYIHDQYTKRIKATSLLEIQWRKIFMNCLYGKFAQKIDTKNIYIESMTKQYAQIKEAIKDKSFLKIVPFSEVRDDCFLVKKTQGFDIPYSIPSFASYVTSYARLELLKKLVEWQAYKPVYCDTDSIFLNIDPNVPDNKQLGGWSKEDKLVTQINGLKNYRYVKNSELKRRLKGVPSKAIEVEPNYYEYETLVKTKEALRRNIDAGISIKRVKNISNNYTKRTVKKDGNTEPIVL